MSKSYIGVLRQYHSTPDRIRKYFPAFEPLVRAYSWEVVTSYVFSRVELAKRMTVYCGIVKLHWCESTLTWKLVSEDYLSRARFYALFNVVFGRKIPDEIAGKLEGGENVRDKIAHGHHWTAQEAREGLISVMKFATQFNDFVDLHGGFRPFGDLRGFKGRKQSLTKATTNWVIRGMGIPKKTEN